MNRTDKYRLVIPAVHLNGSGAENLLRGWQSAAEAIRKAMEALAVTAPHGRDFYVLPDGDEALKFSTIQHRARLNRLQQTREELEELATAVFEQEDQRRRG